MCSDLMLEIKSFVSFKNQSSFLDKGTFQGGKGGSSQYFRVELIPWRTLCIFKEEWSDLQGQKPLKSK